MGTNFREHAGVIVAAIIVLAYAAVGFVQIGAWMVTGTLPPVPPEWNASMLTLAGGALGFLIGKQTTAPPVVSVPVADNTTTTVKTGDTP